MEKKVDSAVLEEVKKRSKDGNIACAVALKIAEEKKVSPRMVGQAANELEIKIRACSLGCFK